MTDTDPTPRGDRPRTQPAVDPDHDRGDHAAASRGATAVSHDADRGDTTREYVARDDVDRPAAHTARDSFLGTDERVHGAANVSWGAIFAGVVTFIALMFVFGLVSAALGFQGTDGMAVGIWSAIALLVALAIAGFVSGTLAVRAGFLHGIGTWATSVVAMLVLVGWLGASVLGTIGGAVGNVAQTAIQESEVSTEDLGSAAEDANIDEQQLNQTQEQVEDTAQDAQEGLAASAWWAVAGLLIGAVVAGLTGAAGARSVHTDHAGDRDLVR